MINVLLCGANGKMGKAVAKAAESAQDIKIAAGFDLNTAPGDGFNVYSDLSLITEDIDCIIDFSHPSVFDAMLSYAEKNKSVYDNLVKSMISGDPKLTIQPGAQKVFGLKEDGSASSSTAIVVNGDYTWDAAQQSAYPDLHFILASGNVYVNAGFEGLIISGQNVIFGNGNVSLTANSSLAAESLGALNEDGKKAADYLVNGDTYLTGTAGKKDVQSGVISFDDYISYSNWKKQ